MATALIEKHPRSNWRRTVILRMDIIAIVDVVCFKIMQLNLVCTFKVE